MTVSVLVSGMVCKLVKSLYGLKQSSRQWNAKHTEELLQLGFVQTLADPSLFTKGTGDSFVALLVYVDDMVLASPDEAQIHFIKEHLHNAFQIKDLGHLKYFLGLEIARNRKGICINQRKYALELLDSSGFVHSKPVRSPMVPSKKLSKESGTRLIDTTQYRKLVGKLLYLTITRPDISFATQQLSQFLDCPTDIHLQAAHRILRYIKGAPAQGHFFPANNQLCLKGFSDSDWAACPDTRRSVSGFCIFLGSALISWKAKKQVTVSRSSSEAEYRVIAATFCEIQWLCYLLKAMEVDMPTPAVLFTNSKSALAIAENPVFHERTKNIKLDCHLIREKLQNGIIKLLHVSSQNQLADVFTKPHAPNTFLSFITKLGLHNMYDPACGGIIEDKQANQSKMDSQQKQNEEAE
ncbi:PREDICTED: uncharacterized protein LOC109191559 [Ipomoea nil]|uniref:uncharacterized protein LOC109191559 n=1 Tax=Ipomoea nil TaxID=35883 RepID=UPI00090201A4|nr:PREDICTED: uncharacterized protein LOC109191559 [Ipomoea nil]